jgi:hypothetical protein
MRERPCNIRATKSGHFAYRTKRQQGYRYPKSSSSTGGKHSTKERMNQQ